MKKQREYQPHSGNSFLADDLLPCPFCGNHADLVFIGNDYTKSRKATVKCSNRSCRVETTAATIRHESKQAALWAIEIWNKRVT